MILSGKGCARCSRSILISKSSVIALTDSGRGFSGATRPDVFVVDLSLPGLSGLELIWLVRLRLPMVRIVVLSMYSNVAHVAEALRGARWRM